MEMIWPEAQPLTGTAALPVGTANRQRTPVQVREGPGEGGSACSHRSSNRWSVSRRSWRNARSRSELAAPPEVGGPCGVSYATSCR
ncbi:hypothetical protein SAMN05216548_1337 [Faunimonas pinastri]|uniref:Uncharacterized protein n=1 Tax=Faunimonas pinastri TaxID=1855383 RepID=A0A1H9QS19_9HYPH|nr:hypothetical protein SAMN05216548_1337 [Faunimonas pinastri]